MQAKITKSPYPQVPNGTVGDIIGTATGGLVIDVEGNFTMPTDGNSQPGKRPMFFDVGQFEVITPETTGTGAELIFKQAFAWLARTTHDNAVAKGFWEARNDIVKACAGVSPALAKAAIKCVDSQLRELIVSEISEACEGDRKDLMDTHLPQFTMVECELADAVIRVADYVAARGLRVGDAILEKMKYNAKREGLNA